MQNYLYNLATDEAKGFIAGIIKAFLFILSCVYGLVVRPLVFLYRLRRYRLDGKVISIGNITLGGTGKTALVEYIAKYLKQQGRKVAILSRGYKRKSTYPVPRTPYPETMGDEPYMLSKNLGIAVIVDADRIRGAKKAIKFYAVDTVILDDGFQQWRIKKDLEIIAIDATNPFGNRHMLPRGILREPLSSLARADIFVLAKTNLNPNIQDIKNFLGRISPSAEIFESVHEPLGFYELDKPAQLLNPQRLQGISVTLFSGIGDPNSFEHLIRNLGIKVGLSFRFRDHHNYTEKDLDNIIKSSQDKNIDTLITTEKDAARILDSQLPTSPDEKVEIPTNRQDNLQLLVLRIALKISKNEDEFHNRLLQLYSR